MTLEITATSEPEDSAIAAGFRYVSDILPGIRRKLWFAKILSVP